MATSDQGNRRFDDGTREAGDRWSGGTHQWSESARQVWLAGVGAWSRAQAEGSKLFDTLVRDGMAAEREGARAHGDASPGGTADVRGFASGAWDRMGQFVEDAVQRSLLRLGVPRREDLEALGRRIDALGEELREARAAAGTTAKPRKTARTTGEGAATRKPPA